MEPIVTYLLMVKFKAKDSEIVASLLCLGNISKDWSTDNMKKAGLNGYVYKFNIDYNPFNPSSINKIMPNIITLLVHQVLIKLCQIFTIILWQSII